MTLLVMSSLGFQPPIVKVQCKRTTAQTPRSEVDQLLGTLGDGEFGIFVKLGSFARGAAELERNRAKLRLINGEQFGPKSPNGGIIGGINQLTE